MPDSTPSGVIVATPPPAKPWWQSKTQWLNLLVVIFVIADEKLQVVQPLVSAEFYGWLVILVAVANFLLRFLTFEALHAPTLPDWLLNLGKRSDS